MELVSYKEQIWQETTYKDMRLRKVLVREYLKERKD